MSNSGINLTFDTHHKKTGVSPGYGKITNPNDDGFFDDG